MTQASRTTETINRDNAAIRAIMHQIRELTVPDRATLAVGLLGHLATMMNRSQMQKLMGELEEEVTRVQDVPPARQQEMPAERGAGAAESARAATSGRGAEQPGDGREDRGDSRIRAVGQAGRGEFRSGDLL
jgi:hypothetical protein